MTKKILIVEDEKNLIKVIEDTLLEESFLTYKALDGETALDMFYEHNPDLILLDINLPKMNGWEVCQNIRKESNIPIIMMTARDSEIDELKGLSIGADDYITKPFNPLEVIARVKTQLRRYQKYNNPTKKQFFPKSEYDIRGLIINKDTHKCFLFGKEISLTPIEFSILWYLCEHQGKVVSTEELFENIWKEKYLDNNNTVMAHIGRLREKLNEPAKNPKFIKTVWGVGYEIE